MQWLREVTGWSSVETYGFTNQKVTGKSLSQIRNEYMQVEDTNKHL
jgi:hypothetical protein